MKALDSQIPVWRRTCSHKELIELFPSLELTRLNTLGSVELCGTKFKRFILLAIRVTENDDLAAHLGQKLDCDVAKS